MRTRLSTLRARRVRRAERRLYLPFAAWPCQWELCCGIRVFVPASARRTVLILTGALGDTEPTTKEEEEEEEGIGGRSQRSHATPFPSIQPSWPAHSAKQSRISESDKRLDGSCNRSCARRCREQGSKGCGPGASDTGREQKIRVVSKGYEAGARGYGPGARGYGPGARGYGPGAKGYGPGAKGDMGPEQKGIKGNTT